MKKKTNFIELPKPEAPRCLECGKLMTPAYDDIAKKVTGYLFQCVTCYPNLILSIG